ncbi:lytic transglycosylase domain-containing protein [Canibacter zhoujuaniae]|uniref:lytic transglycosylase domain-containing protein n=1 Tax=Canibacter zhoujuaniae TaxID=2708343 RepID=UPI00142497E2|nr:lytic transglycosylase domain-containing protein [Canibacter zhoujuaniae]
MSELDSESGAPDRGKQSWLENRFRDLRLSRKDWEESDTAHNEQRRQERAAEDTRATEDVFAELTGGEKLFTEQTAPIETLNYYARPPRDFATAGMRRIFTAVVLVIAFTLLIANGIAVVGLLNEDGSEEADSGAAAVADEAAEGEDSAELSENAVPLTADADKDAQDAASVSDVEPFTALVADETWLTATAEKVGIPRQALAAYAAAELTVKQEFPSCNIGWNTIAAIGSVESNHGTINGASLDEDGRVRPRIIGQPLDGKHYLATPDTDHGLYDNDTVWDHAVGPMQFIPSTWEHYKRDANGDGKADIDNVHDAALSAATLLCTEGGDLSTEAGYIAAIRAYNPNVQYNNAVVAEATRYLELSGY